MKVSEQCYEKRMRYMLISVIELRRYVIYSKLVRVVSLICNSR